MRYYAVNTTTHWGDSGAILIGGIGYRPSRESPLELERTGPFVPELSVQSGLLVVAPLARNEFENQWMDLLTRREVNLQKAVRSSWDGILKEGQDVDWRYEPEHIISDGSNDEQIARQIGELIAYDPAKTVTVTRFTVDFKAIPFIIRYHGGVTNGALGTMLLPGGFWLYCDDTFKEWVCARPYFHKWLEFRTLIRE